MDQNQDIVQIDVHIVEEMEESVLIKDFLLYNKHVLNVLEVVKKLLTLVQIVVDKETNKLLKKFQLLFLRVSTMVQE